jgi:hypothetical protein
MDILREARTPYTVYPGETKMYRDLKQSFRWKLMKVDIAKYVPSFGICQKVKVEHHRPAASLNPLEISKWKCRIKRWTLWLVCLALLEAQMLFGLLLID